MEENARTHLAIANQQRAIISGAIINLHGFVIGANAIILSTLVVAHISIGGALPIYIFLGSAVSSLIIGLWRYYVQYLDNQIAGLYPEIILLESLIPATEYPTGLRAHLVWNYPRLHRIFSSNFTPEQQVHVVEALVREKRIGNRGHWPFNLVAIIFIIVLLIVSILSFDRIPDAPWEWYYTFAVILILLGLALVIFAWVTGQRNPSEETITNITSIPERHSDNQEPSENS